MVGTPYAFGVDNAKTWALFPSSGHSDSFVKLKHGLLKTAFVFPLSKVIIDRVVRREVLGEHSPLAAAYKRVKDGIHNFNQTVFSFALRRVKEIFNRVPLVVGDVGWIICHNHVKF